MQARRLRRLFNLYLPLRGAGIRVEELADDWSYARVALHQRWYNLNYVGTHFGGSLFAMTDPFWMIMVMESLGYDYVVWDKAAEIEFVSPGRGSVIAEFRLDPARVETIRKATESGDKHLEWFETQVRAQDQSVVAKVRKQLHIRRKVQLGGNHGAA